MFSQYFEPLDFPPISWIAQRVGKEPLRCWLCNWSDNTGCRLGLLDQPVSMSVKRFCLLQKRLAWVRLGQSEVTCKIPLQKKFARSLCLIVQQLSIPRLNRGGMDAERYSPSPIELWGVRNSKLYVRISKNITLLLFFENSMWMSSPQVFLKFGGPLSDFL